MLICLRQQPVWLRGGNDVIRRLRDVGSVLPAAGKVARRHHRDRRKGRDGGARAPSTAGAEAAVGVLLACQERQTALHGALLLRGDLVALDRIVHLLPRLGGGRILGLLGCRGLSLRRSDRRSWGGGKANGDDEEQAKEVVHRVPRVRQRGSWERFWLRLR